MSKKDNSPAISFFSFQDIITSITGIMFLVVMMLVLMLLNRPGSSSPEEKQLQGDLRQLKRELKDMEDIVRRKKPANTPLLQHIPDEKLPEMKRSLLAAMQAGEAEIKKNSKAEISIIDLLEQEKNLTEKAVAEKLRIDKENELLQQQIRMMEQALAKMEKQQKSFYNIFRQSWSQYTSKKPLFLECSGKGIIAGTPNEPEKLRQFQDIQDCIAWCRASSPNDICFILLIKPSAFNYAERLSRELQHAGYERGREVVPDEKNLLQIEGETK